MTALPNPFLDLPSEKAISHGRFVLDEEAFLSDIEPLPTFLSRKPLRADDLIPMLEVLAKP